MDELPTKPSRESVAAFLNNVVDQRRLRDCRTVLRMMKEETKAEPKMWGSSIVGFGSYHYRYASGREGDWFLTGFSPRKRDLTLYIMPGFDRYDALLSKLGKYRTGKSCLYIKSLADVDLDVLKQLIRQSVKQMPRVQEIDS
jgi:hypothetical protein